MSDQNLFLPICGPLLFLIILVVAILGMRARIRFAKRIHNAYVNEDKFGSWFKTHGQKQRALLLTALIAILGILLFGSLIFIGILSASKLVAGILIGFLLATIVSGILILRDYDKLAK